MKERLLADVQVQLSELTERRSARTRRQITTAFTRLVFAQGFEKVSVSAVVSAAGVARSTFYEHFSDKEDVLRACMNFLFVVIADCVSEDQMPKELEKALAHLWENRRLTDGVFSGQARVVLSRNQADLVELRLRQNESLRLPSRLAAIEIAEAQLALIESWMRGRAFCSIEQLAEGLHRVSRASALALIADA
jgi:AcrR family transcriptional regulator